MLIWERHSDANQDCFALKEFGVTDRGVELIVQGNLWALGRRWRKTGARRM